MGKDVTAKPGRYRVASTPYQQKPQEDFHAEDVQVLVFLWASRMGKTEMENNLIGAEIEQNPRNILFVWPTLDRAKIWSKQFLVPMIRSCPVLRRLIRENKTRDADNTILSKKFPSGNISIIGSNSPSGFRGIQAPVVICDEIDAMENGKEGDPVTLAFKRAENFKDSIQVVSSTPTIRGQSRIESWYEKSDRQQWFCPCPKCGHKQTLKWSQVKWADADIAAAWYECESCQSKLTDAERFDMVMRGEWQATAPFTGIRGYFLNGINSTFPPKKGYKTKLHQMVAEFLDAKGTPDSLKTWTNTFLAETWADKVDDKPDWKTLFDRCEEYGGSDPQNPIIHEDACVLEAAVDMQNDRLELTVVGVGLGEETYAVEHRRIWGDPKKPDVWKYLDIALDKTYTHALGPKLKIAICVFDTGDGKNQKPAYTFIKPRQGRRIFAVKGSSTANAPLLATAKLQKKSRIQLFTIGTDTAKATIYGRLNLEDPGPGFMHYPKGFGFDEAYFKQLTAEDCYTTYEKGVARRKWDPKGRRNEALDNRVYILGAHEILNPNLPKLTEQIEANAPKSESKDYQLKPAEAPRPPDPLKPQSFVRRSLPRRGGFVSGWKR